MIFICFFALWKGGFFTGFGANSFSGRLLELGICPYAMNPTLKKSLVRSDCFRLMTRSRRPQARPMAVRRPEQRRCPTRSWLGCCRYWIDFHELIFFGLTVCSAVASFWVFLMFSVGLLNLARRKRMLCSSSSSRRMKIGRHSKAGFVPMLSK